MSQHISANSQVSQSIDHGEFILIKDARLRKDLILLYGPMHSGGDQDHWVLGLHYSGGAQNYALPMKDEEEARMWCEKLDWIFKKDQAK